VRLAEPVAAVGDGVLAEGRQPTPDRFSADRLSAKPMERGRIIVIVGHGGRR